MDPASLVAAFVAAQMSRVQFAAAAAMMRMNADAAQSVAQVVQAAEQNAQHLADLAAGIGRNLNITA
jgi:ribosomal protein L22